MAYRGESPIVIAGAGIAGLTMAIALARRGIACRVFEQAPKLEAFGAGLQISPNAARILTDLGVLPYLRPHTVQPQAVRLKDANTLRELASVPLGKFAEQRWNAPYLVSHRADLQQALLTEARSRPEIEINTGMKLAEVSHERPGHVTVSFGDSEGNTTTAESPLLIGADGVWSASRRFVEWSARNRFSGQIAWRTTIDSNSPAGEAFGRLADSDSVTTFVHASFHLVAYPLRAGAEINLVAFTPAMDIAQSWAVQAEMSILLYAVARSSPALARLVEMAGHWTAWPLHTVDPAASWTAPGIALIGDAAHAVTPFAAQGAAMAIEDAALLAQYIAEPTAPEQGAISLWEQQRKARLSKVARRGALNKMAWNAAGPVALARNLVLRMRSPQSLATDLDWLYGWRLPQER
ncbi:FAD-dependent monooxygenase [Aquamicrobium sp.]|uniref:FAD-dependent monooxygenase n=1 Tax=Aquamicrobium sp. TaxID=1872579 RepID=UPI00258CB6AE|nr:FAD-dependent monooxygenase [Aquamicrobium sp.]MCK9554100.1 FAD-dependent monooxygenase [Aquamicrobium sp.]